MSEFKLLRFKLRSAEYDWTARSSGFAIRVLMTSALLYGAAAISAFAQESNIEFEGSVDIPEEVLQSELILHGRSPIDGEQLTPAEYAQMQDQLQVARADVPARLAPGVHRIVFLLRLRKVVTTLFPFLK